VTICLGFDSTAMSFSFIHTELLITVKDDPPIMATKDLLRSSSIAMPRGIELTGILSTRFANGNFDVSTARTDTLYECQLLTRRLRLSAVLEITLGVFPVMMSGTSKESFLAVS